ncbi:hypothetical protein [Arundinibacter roseus]|uniref:Uncharacterized protein n=1 Tax=Arundinibacter roseus TaxID=2070510 RepID=A0A4V6P8N9_9BACT|nr:hypothetical protein [Arundinibacter roseus]TDB65905.1 hypothetical protein EZE20_09055 [Arundinibacter roseus]
MKEFLLNVYEGIYFIAKKYETQPSKLTINGRFFATFLSYHFSLVTILIGIFVLIYGPFKLSLPVALFLLFGLFGLIYWYLLYPHRNTGEIDENMEEALVKKKKRIALYVQVGGIISIALAVTIIYFLYKIFDPKSMAR